jgi:predicted nuclease with RNAse H fold
MAFQHFIGVDLGGGKGKNTAVAHLRAVDEPGTVKVQVVSYGTGRDAPFFDDRLIDELRQHPDALVAIDAPLSLPACVRCQLPACPGHAACDEPILRWFRARDRQHEEVVSLVPRKPRYTSYTQRATEVLLAEVHDILPRETLGQGMGPLTARASYLTRALAPAFELGRNLIEVYPKATLYQLLGKHLVEKYKRSAESRDVRLRILNALPELGFGPAWKEFALDNDHKFDAILCAYTAYLYSRGACLPPDDDVVAKDGWIWIPAAP